MRNFWSSACSFFSHCLGALLGGLGGAHLLGGCEVESFIRFPAFRCSHFRVGSCLLGTKSIRFFIENRSNE